MHSHMICTRPCAIVTNSTTFRSCPLLEAGFKRLKKRSDPGNGTAPGGNQRRQTGRPSRLQHPLQVVLTDGVSEPLLVVEMSLNSTTYPDLPADFCLHDSEVKNGGTTVQCKIARVI